MLVLLSVALFIIGWFIRNGINIAVSVLKTKLDSFEYSLKILERAAVSEEGQTISQAKQLETMKVVYNDLTKHSEKCFTYHAELTNATNDLAELRRDIDQFIQDGKDARAVTQELISKLDGRLDTFMEKILDVIRNLSDLGVRRG